MNDTNLIEDLRRLAPPDYWWLIGLALAVETLLAAVWLWRRFRRAPRPAPASPDGLPDRPPWETALAALERLAALLRPEA